MIMYKKYTQKQWDVYRISELRNAASLSKVYLKRTKTLWQKFIDLEVVGVKNARGMKQLDLLKLKSMNETCTDNYKG